MSEHAVVALVLGAEERARLRNALGARITPSFASTLSEARVLLRQTRNVIAVIAEPRDQEGRATAGWIRALMTTHTPVAVIGYCRAGAHTAQDIFAFANAGAHDLVFHGVDDSGAGLRRVLATAQQIAVAEEIGSQLSAFLPERACAMMEYCLQYPHQARTVQAVAIAMGYNRKTLSKYCAERQLPPPEAFVSWSRLLLAAQRLKRGMGTVESVALDLDFATATALRNMLRRHTGLRPTDLRNPSGLQTLLAAFRDIVARGRIESTR